MKHTYAIQKPRGLPEQSNFFHRKDRNWIYKMWYVQLCLWLFNDPQCLVNKRQTHGGKWNQ